MLLEQNQNYCFTSRMGENSKILREIKKIGKIVSRVPGPTSPRPHLEQRLFGSYGVRVIGGKAYWRLGLLEVRGKLEVRVL